MGEKMVRFERGYCPHGAAFDSMRIEEDAVVPPGERWLMVRDPWVWRVDCTPAEAARLAAICRKYGVAYSIDGKAGAEAGQAPDYTDLAGNVAWLQRVGGTLQKEVGRRLWYVRLPRANFNGPTKDRISRALSRGRAVYEKRHKGGK